MDIESLIDIWKEQDEHLDQQLNVNQHLLKEVSLNRVHELLRGFKFERIFEILSYVIFSGLIISFLSVQPLGLRFASPAILLLVWSLGELVWSSYQLVLTAQISLGAPILQAQRTLEKLKLNTIRERNLLYVVIPLFPVALLAVCGKAWFDVDVFELFGIHIAYFAAGSFIISALIVWLLKRFPDPKLERALSFLQEISQFEREEG